MKVQISRDTEKVSEQKIYSIRTGSYERGEEFAILEEILFEIEDLRVLKDSNGTYLYELGQYNSEKEAQEKLEEYKEVFKDSLSLYVEERTMDEVPQSMK